MNALISFSDIITVRHNRPMVSSLKIAELFERRHDKVLEAIRTKLVGLLQLPVSGEMSLDDRGRERPVYWLDEEAALILMPFLGGRKSVAGQQKLVRAYLWYRDNFANPPRKDLIAAKRAAHHPMMDALVEIREEVGKDTKTCHFQCENKLVNWVVTGAFAKIDEAALSNDQVELLRQIRERNAAYLLAGLDYDARKVKLAQFATRARTKLISA